MGNLAEKKKSYENVLPEFQKFLLDKKFTDSKYVSYCAVWVDKFLKFSQNYGNLSFLEQQNKFLALLEGAQSSEWQLRQAQDALKIYFEHFKGQKTSNLEISADPTDTPGDILEKARRLIRVKHFSYSTERTYLDWIKRFFEYTAEVKKKEICSSGLSSEDVTDFLTFLAINKRVSSSTQNQAFNALLFLFRDVLGAELGNLDKTVRAKRGLKLPVVLSVREVQELFKQIKGRDLLIAQVLYGSGLRLMELARLRAQDIDFDNNLIFVRAAKGDKDRSTILPQAVKGQLRLHLEEVKKLHDKDLVSGYGEVFLPDSLGRKMPNAGKEWRWQYVFPSSKLSVDPRSGKVRRHHIDETSIQKAVRAAVNKAGIVKHATVHTMRHSFATHLLQNGVNIREVQELLGHKNVETTMIYTHVLRDMSNAPKSPLDELYAVTP
jgi:integron integrase